MKKLMLVLLLVGGGCYDDTSAPAGDPPIRLSGVMKLAADSLTVSLRVQNVSDTTQVLAWHECLTAHAANFGVFETATQRRPIWEQQRLPRRDCPHDLQQELLSPDESHLIRGAPISVEQILGDSIAEGSYHIAILPVTLLVRPAGASYEMPVEGTIRIGTVELRRSVTQ